MGKEKVPSLFQRSRAQLSRAAKAAKEAEGKAARTIGAATTKNTRKEGKDVFSVADPKAPGGRRRLRGAAGAKKSGKKDEVRSLTRRGRRTAAKTIGTGAVAVAATRGGEDKKDKGGKGTPKTKKYNVGVSKGGVPFNEAFGYYRGKGQKQFTWNGKKYTTELDTEKAKRLASKKKKVGPIRKFLLGEDGKFGGKRGAIDFLPGKSRPGRQGGSPTSPASAKGRKIVSKAGGGMMKSKMASKGGAKGGKKMAPGYKMGGSAKKFPDMTGDGKVTQKDILKARGVPGFSKGAMAGVLQDLMTKGARAAEKKYGKTAVNQAKKELNIISGVKTKQAAKTPKEKKLAAADFRAERRGKAFQTTAGKKQAQVERNEMRMASGGSAKKTPKGYSKGGVARKGKPRGVGVALRGYGKALR
jgi:hypothetical protein